MHMLKITLAGSAAQAVIPPAVGPSKAAPFSGLVFSYNGSNAMYIGDSTVSATTGIPLLKGVPLPIFPALEYTGDLTEFFVIGTTSDVLNVMVLD